MCTYNIIFWCVGRGCSGMYLHVIYCIFLFWPNASLSLCAAAMLLNHRPQKITEVLQVLGRNRRRSRRDLWLLRPLGGQCLLFCGVQFWRLGLRRVAGRFRPLGDPCLLCWRLRRILNPLRSWRFWRRCHQLSNLLALIRRQPCGDPDSSSSSFTLRPRWGLR